MNQLDLRQLSRLINKLLSRIGDEDRTLPTITDRRIDSASDAVTVLEEDIAAISHLVHILDITIEHIERVGGPDA